MKKIMILAACAALSACASSGGMNTEIGELDAARAMIAKAKAAGAEKCAPEQQATAVAKLYHAAHEYTEHGVHPDEPGSLANASEKAAAEAYAISKKGCGKPAPAPAPVKQEVISLQGVYFNTNSAELTAASTVKLDEAVATLKRRGDISVEVAAHTDSRGKDSYNLALSDRRAQSVMQYLIAHGIAADRLTAKGYGETQPVADNASAEGRAQNRRVELRVQ